jgi:ADP-ribosylglycohydrolase
MGDAITHSSMQRTRFAAPLWMERILGRILANDRTYNMDRFVVPFIMNQDPNLLLMSPSSRTEWAIFTAQLLLAVGDDLSSDRVGEYWMEHLVKHKDSVRSGLAERSAMINLSRGLLPPMSGMDNPHFYDDGAISRAVSVGIRFWDDPLQAAENARAEATVSHDEDGIWGAMAMASAIAHLICGSGYEEAIDTSVRYFPKGSWIKQQWDLVCTIDLQKDPFDLLLELDSRVVDKTYSYANLAPQTLPLAFTLFKKTQGDLLQGIALANCLPRVSDSVVPFVGALLGAQVGTEAISEDWKTRLSKIKGTFVPSAAEGDLARLASALMDMNAGRRG